MFIEAFWKQWIVLYEEYIRNNSFYTQNFCEHQISLKIQTFGDTDSELSVKA